jgi:hypothetical protein
MTMVASGNPIAVVPSREKILESIDIVKPTHFSAVPLLINRVSFVIAYSTHSSSALQWCPSEGWNSISFETKGFQGCLWDRSVWSLVFRS